MKTVLSVCIACSAASLLGLLGLSAFSLAPGLEARRWTMIFVVALLLVA
jgi:hypothetical protein